MRAGGAGGRRAADPGLPLPPDRPAAGRGRTGKVVNVKKGQFLAPWDMVNVAPRSPAPAIPTCCCAERGASFGYNTLVSDMRALPIMARTGAPVVFDATHSVQQPGGQGATTGGEREIVPVLARAAVAVGVAAVFMEVHQDPDHAPSDGPNMRSMPSQSGAPIKSRLPRSTPSQFRRRRAGEARSAPASKFQSPSCAWTGRPCSPACRGCGR
jgi:hypothetical protein